MTDGGARAGYTGKPITAMARHLVRVRWFLVRSAIVVAVTTGLSFVFAGRVFAFFTSRAPSISFIYINLTGMLSTYMKVCLYSGLILAMPFFVFELLRLIRPALPPGHRLYLYAAAPAMLVLFLAGAGYTYFIFMPPAFKILLGTQWIPGVVPRINISSYMSFVARSLFWIGLLFELPIVAFFLAKTGTISYRSLLRKWRWALLGSVLIAGALTPTGNPFRQTLSAIFLMDTGFIVSGPILLLYLLSILLAWAARKHGAVPAMPGIE